MQSIPKLILLATTHVNPKNLSQEVILKKEQEQENKNAHEFKL